MRLFKWLRPRSRVNYWSCSEFADKVRKKFGTSKPHAATLEEWDEWELHQKMNHNFVYWLTEDFFSFAQDVVMFPADVIDELRVRFRARFVDKYWCLDTKLPKQQYYEIETRLLHGMFEMLVDFVEVEKAHMTMWLDKDDEVKAMKPFAYRHRFLWFLRWKPFRSREMGMKYLEWETTLDDDKPEDERGPYVHPDGGTTLTQAQCAREIIELYTWWKDVRPKRADPYDSTGWTAYCNGEDTGRTSGEMLDDLNRIEREEYVEDEEMMMRIIKIRNHLWT